MGGPRWRVDGMDGQGVHECVVEHPLSVGEERQPTLVDALTYRFRGHCAADPEVYRTKEEVQQWRERDSIATFAKLLQESGDVDEQGFEELDRKAVETVD